MTKSERATISRNSARTVARRGSERIAMFGGGYGGGRWLRNSEIQGYPATVAVGIVGLIGMRRARSRGGQAAGYILAGMVGAGCYGMGKIGEEHGIKAGNDGNLFSWSSTGGVKLD